MELVGKNTGATIYILDSDPDFADSVGRLVGSLNLRVEKYSDARSFLRDFDADRAGCLIVDTAIPGMSGLDLQERLLRESVKLPVIVVSSEGRVDAAVRAMKAGAVDFIEKPCTPAVILECIGRALELDARTRTVGAERARIAARMALLTPREREVMELLVSGMSTKQIAVELGLSRKTVDAYRSHVRIKLVAESLVDLVRMAQLCVESGNRVEHEVGRVDGPILLRHARPRGRS